MFSCTRGEKICPVVVFQSAVRPVVGYCKCIQSHPEIRSFKEKQTTKNTPPKPHSLRNTRLISYQATSKWLSCPTHPLGWDDVIQECDMIGHEVVCKQDNTHWLSAPAESIFLCHLPSSTHSHWAMPFTVTQEFAARGATKHCFHGVIELVQRRLVGVIWRHYHLVFNLLGSRGPQWLQS